MTIEIIPAILPASIDDLTSSLERVKGIARTVQIDIVDGKFAQNTTWPYQGDDGTFGKMIREEQGFPFWDDFDFELDMMIAHPESVIPDWVKAGVSRTIIHLESAPPDAISDIIREWKHVIDIGIALKPSTPLESLEIFLHEIKFVQCMGNDKIGFNGVTLDEERVLPKIRSLRQKYPQLDISVDIGVNKETVPRLVQAGANRLVSGSAILKSDNPKGAVEELLRVAEESVDNES